MCFCFYGGGNPILAAALHGVFVLAVLGLSISDIYTLNQAGFTGVKDYPYAVDKVYASYAILKIKRISFYAIVGYLLSNDGLRITGVPFDKWGP